MSKQALISKLKTGTPQLSIGTLTGSMMNQGQEISILENAGVNLLHLDVMDGHAWPKITVGAPFLAGLKTDLIKDVHLLVSNPENHIADFIGAGANIITIHPEHTDNLEKALDALNSTDALSSVGIYPSTPLEEITPYLDKIDVVFVLAIGPDTGKETFFDLVTERVNKLRMLKPGLVIAIDGAVKKNNIADIAKIKPDLIVTGSAVFDGNDAAANITEMNASISSVS
ncbi:MAG: ribulose-phosphate 3-epimerase [Akkermansiaceae bacterium]